MKDRKSVGNDRQRLSFPSLCVSLGEGNRSERVLLALHSSSKGYHPSAPDEGVE